MLPTSIEIEIEVVVTEAVALTAKVTRYRLERPDQSPLPPFTAGAHILVGIAPGLTRAYSLCGNPQEQRHYEIAVKREDDGRGGSQALHAQARSGTRLQISAPRNLFALAPQAPFHLLLGGGIGITPLIAMAHQLQANRAAFSLACFSRSAAELPFTGLLREGPWQEQVQVHLDDAAPLDLAYMIAQLPAGAHVYCCGPAGFMRWARSVCSALPAAQWHEESFGGSDAQAVTPATSSTAATTATATQTAQLYLANSQRQVPVAAGQTLLNALRASGVEIDSACEQGVCGSCVVAYSDGQPIHGDECLNDEERAGHVAVCRAACGSATLTLHL